MIIITITEIIGLCIIGTVLLTWIILFLFNKLMDLIDWIRGKKWKS